MANHVNINSFKFYPAVKGIYELSRTFKGIIVDFYNELKSITSGYASFDYEDSE